VSTPSTCGVFMSRIASAVEYREDPMLVGFVLVLSTPAAVSVTFLLASPIPYKKS